MELDLTRLNSLVSQTAVKPSKIPSEMFLCISSTGILYKQENLAEGEIDGRTVYQVYQQNIALSGQLQADILKGVKAGESPYSLLLKAVEAISLMTSNGLLYTQVEADIKSIYGAGLLESYPLQRELEEVQGRQQRLREALQREGEPEDSRQRIKSAIAAHENESERLQALINK